jgi:PAS domain S-box-containing protein
MGIYCSLIDYYQSLLAQGNQISLCRIDQTLAPEVQSVANQFGIHAILMTPLVYQREWLGSICLYQCDREREWTVSELEFVKAIADHCAIAIHRARLYQQLQTELAERKQAETALQKLNEELEVKVEERTFVLKQLNQQLLFEIAERNQAQKALQKSEEQFRSLSACSPVGIFLSDVNGRCTYINPRTQAIAGFSFTFEESLQEGWTEFVHPEDRERVFAEWSTYAQSGHEYSNEFRFQTPKRNVSWVHVRSSPMFSDKGELIGHVGTIEDITERKQAEDVLRSQLASVEAATDGIAILNHEGEFIYLNNSYVKIFGYSSASELIGKTWRELYFQKEIKHFEHHVFPSLLQNKKWQGEATAKKQDGTTFAQEVSLTSIEGEGLICVCRDITERKWAEEQLKASLKEKEVLLKEIHHRVKNNLQIISSLLKLQSGYIKDEEAFNLFTDIYNRVRSMAILHEQLYQSEDLSRIKAKEYICKLVENLSRSYGVSSTHVSIQVEVDDIELDIDTSISCGLIVNELITNSFKYAFLGMEYGEIFIKLLQNKDMDITLVISDTGIGLSPEFNIHKVDSLGLQLVSNLIEKLEGNLEIDCSLGTSFKIIFTRINKWSR